MMSTGDENRHYLRAFINTYRNLPVLWDTSLREYSNREKRAEAYEQLVPIYRYLKRDASVEDVKKKINTLRTNYRKELKVVESARRAGTVHHPRCWTFHDLNFLRNSEKFLSVTPNARDSSFTYNDGSMLKMQNSNGTFLDTNYSSFRSLVGGGSMGDQTSPPNVAEMFQKSFGQSQSQPQKLEPQQTPPPGSHSDFSEAAHMNHHHHEDGKRQRLSSLGSIKMQSPEELIGIACEYLSTTFPEEESIVRTWTQKLKRMHRDQRLLAEKFINDILFEGESGNLSRGSVQINSFEPFVRFEEQSTQHHHAAGSSSDEQLVKSHSPSSESKNLNTTEANASTSAANSAGDPDSFPNFS